jgi:hypothetical protein
MHSKLLPSKTGIGPPNTHTHTHITSWTQRNPRSNQTITAERKTPKTVNSLSK